MFSDEAINEVYLMLSNYFCCHNAVGRSGFVVIIIYFTVELHEAKCTTPRFLSIAQLKQASYI